MIYCGSRGASPHISRESAQMPGLRADEGLDAGDTQIPVSGGNLPIYYAAPKKAGKYPVVMVVPEIWGLHEYQKDICRRLAKAGYYGVSLDNYFRQGQLWKLADIKEVLAGANHDLQGNKDYPAVLFDWVAERVKR